MKRHIEEEISAIRERLLYMGGIAEEMIHLASKGLTDRDAVACDKVFELEEEVNGLQLEIYQAGIRVLALYQPEASDLRTVMASVKINDQIERIADQAKNIAQTVSFHMLKEAPLETLLEIPRMATIAKGMLKQALDAYSLKNPETAKTVLYYEKEENLLKTQMVNCIIELLQKEKECTKQLVDLILIAKNLEKIGDHATNIAEDVIFMTLGADIRHAIASPIPS